MATNLKKTSVANRVPNTFVLSTDGDIGINTYDGRLWVSNGSVVSEIGAGAGIPSGSNTQVQFNDSGAFGGDSLLIFDKSTSTLTTANLTVNDTAIINTNSITIGDASLNTVISAALLDLGGQINANNSLGTAGQVLKSGGVSANAYWDAALTSGTATLVAGTVTVSTAAVTTTTRIFLTTQSLGTVTVPKSIAVTSRVNGTSFTITSEDNTDTSVIAWMFIQP